MTFERNAKPVLGDAAGARSAPMLKNRQPSRTHIPSAALLPLALALLNLPAQADIPAFLEQHCMKCHDADTKKGNLNFEGLKADYSEPESFARWVKVFDRIDSGEMPPKKEKRPAPADVKAVTTVLSKELTNSELARLKEKGSTGMRRLTRAEYENTLRDLFDMPGLALQALLPADGTAHGFDKNSDALEVSHVNIAKYVEAADQALDLAIATRPKAPASQKVRISLLDRGGSGANLSMQGDVITLRDQKADPLYPPASAHRHLDQGAHERIGSFETDSSVGVFRKEDESVNYYFRGHTTIYPGRYRVRTSLWSYQWDKGQVLPSRGTEAARLAVVQLTSDGRGGQHPNYTLGYFDAPSLQPTEHQLELWLNHNELLGFDVASLAPAANYSRKDRAMGFTGPGIAVDWMEVEGPLHDVWPPRPHQRLFGALPIEEFVAKDHPDVHPPDRKNWEKTWLRLGKNQPDPVPGIWTVRSDDPRVDAKQLLGTFLPKAFRKPVDEGSLSAYLTIVELRIKAGACFESAMREAYRAALCSPDFLYHVEPATKLEGNALACRLSYFLWNSAPDDELTAAHLEDPKILRAQTERLLRDARSQRFVEDFLGQWLKLRLIAANDPDKKLYPEFSPYLQDSMVAETRAYFCELIEKNLDATHLVQSRFAMLNQKLATHYGIEGVVGPKIRRVELPQENPRGGFLTQAAILKVTANGTTTSPVVRGAFVLDRLLGQPPEPPPSNVPAVEPDVRGTTTIREQLAEHRNNAICASCHAKIDPPGFALETFDVIGGERERYRLVAESSGDPAPRGSIDPFIGISFKLGPKVDATGETTTGQTFANIRDMQRLLASKPEVLLRSLAQNLLVYSTGREVSFTDRPALQAILEKTGPNQGVRTLLHEIIQSPLFQTR
jgi:mono/diheme cytochrome c family protein